MKSQQYRLTSNFSYGFLLIITSTLLFSSKAVFIKLAYRYDVNPDTLIALRMFFAAPFFIYFSIKAKRTYKTPLDAKTLAIIAFTCICGYYLASIFDLYGLLFISASLERLILYIYPTLVLILSALLFKERIKPALWICIAITYIGLLVVFLNDTNDAQQVTNINTLIGMYSSTTIGCLLVFCSAIMFAIYMIGSEHIMRTVPSRLFTSYGMLITCIAVGLHFSARQPLELFLTQHTQVYILAVVLAILCTVLPSFLLSAGIQRVGASTASAVGSMGPVATLILAYLVLDERITALQLLGFAIVIAAIIALGKLRKDI